MKKTYMHIRVSQELKEALARHAADHGMSLTGLLLVSVAFQNPELKDTILRER